MLNSCTKLGNGQVHCSVKHLLNDEYYAEILGNEQDLALLFLDIRNYTQLMEENAVYEVLYTIKQVLFHFTQAIVEFGGRVIEVSGDNIYAVFGLEGSLPQASEHALEAAYKIFAALNQLNEDRFFPHWASKLEIGIGIHVGKVIVGHSNLDTGDRMTVTGLAVNIASRLQAETKVLNNNLLISEQAYALLSKPFSSGKSELVHLRGIADPVKIRLMGRPYKQEAHYGDPTQDDLHLLMYLAG